MTLDWVASAGSVKAGVTVILFALFWLWESWLPFFDQRRGRLAHAGHNVAIAVLNTVLLSVLFAAITASFARWTTENRIGVLYLLPLGTWSFLTLAILAQDAWMYLWHRANHRIAFLWRFHRMHHSDNAMDVTTATRFHIGEHIGASVLRLGLIPLVGLRIGDLILYQILVVAITMFHHANISMGPFDKWLRYLFVTPYMHKVHHSRIQVETDSNYSTLFSFWDRLAFSFRSREDHTSIHFGLEGYDDRKWQTVPMMLVTPFKDAPRDPQSSRDHVQS